MATVLVMSPFDDAISQCIDDYMPSPEDNPLFLGYSKVVRIVLSAAGEVWRCNVKDVLEPWKQDFIGQCFDDADDYLDDVLQTMSNFYRVWLSDKAYDSHVYDQQLLALQESCLEDATYAAHRTYDTFARDNPKSIHTNITINVMYSPLRFRKSNGSLATVPAYPTDLALTGNCVQKVQCALKQLFNLTSPILNRANFFYTPMYSELMSRDMVCVNVGAEEKNAGLVLVEQILSPDVFAAHHITLLVDGAVPDGFVLHPDCYSCNYYALHESQDCDECVRVKFYRHENDQGEPVYFSNPRTAIPSVEVDLFAEQLDSTFDLAHTVEQTTQDWHGFTLQCRTDGEHVLVQSATEAQEHLAHMLSQCVSVLYRAVSDLWYMGCILSCQGEILDPMPKVFMSDEQDIYILLGHEVHHVARSFRDFWENGIDTPLATIDLDAMNPDIEAHYLALLNIVS